MPVAELAGRIAKLRGSGSDGGRGSGTLNYEIAHTTLYKVHQRVAKTFRLGRAFLVGDAAHINNPLGGMGMNGGIHDAVNLAARLARCGTARRPKRN